MSEEQNQQATSVESASPDEIAKLKNSIESLERKNFELIGKLQKKELIGEVPDDYHHEYDESWPSFKARVESGLENLCDQLSKSRPRYAVVYTSGGVISVAVGKILGLSPEKTFALNWAITNTSITTLRLVGNEPQLLSLNEHHFIKAENSNLLTWI